MSGTVKIRKNVSSPAVDAVSGYAGVEKASGAYLSIDPDYVYFNPGTGAPETDNTIDVTCDGYWTLVVSHVDIHADKNNGTGNDVVTITCEAGDPQEPLGTVTFSREGALDEVCTINRAY